MRKFSAIVFMLIYANIGLAMAINFHFCNGHLSQVSLIKIYTLSTCCCKSKSMANDCCKNEVVLVKPDNHQSQTSLAIPESGFKILTLPVLLQQNAGLYASQNESPVLPVFSRLRSPRIGNIFLAIRNLRI
jgi:hypothetical protein